jgi:hypothetical protein
MKLRFNISMSLDGYVAGPKQSVEQPLGEGGEQLHGWAFATRTCHLFGWKLRQTASTFPKTVAFVFDFVHAFISRFGWLISHLAVLISGGKRTFEQQANV